MLNVEDPDIDSLAHELARLEGSTITEVVKRALRERHAALLLRQQREDADRRVREIQARVARMPVLDPRDHGEMLYDENGAPR